MGQTARIGKTSSAFRDDRVIMAMVVLGIVSGIGLLALWKMGVTPESAGVYDILQTLGIINPPTWLVYAILAAGTTAVIISLLAGVGIITLPAWAGSALLAADAFFA